MRALNQVTRSARSCARGTAALLAAAVLAGCSGAAETQPAGAGGGSGEGQTSVPRPQASRDGRQLPVVAAGWPGHSRKPVRSLEWQQSAAAGKPLEVTLEAERKPVFVSFLAHQKVDDKGIPEEGDPRKQRVWSCGQGVESPKCRIVRQSNGTYTLTSKGTADASHPYRLVYVQWPASGPKSKERWVSWQLPAG